MSYVPPPSPDNNQPESGVPTQPPAYGQAPQSYNPPTYAQPAYPNQGSAVGGGIMQTAKYGMYGLIATGIGFVLGLIGLPFGGIFSIGGLVLAIMSLVKKETPKWPAWVTIGLAIAGFVITLLAVIALFALGGAVMMS